MTVIFAALCLSLLAALVFTIVNSRRERETMLRAVEMAIREGNRERAIHANTVRELSDRIIAPEAAPFIAQNGEVPKQHLGELGEAEAEQSGWDE